MFRVILNVIWLIFCGLWMAIAYVLAGLLAFVLIITIPFGIAAFRIAGYVLWPFGRTIDRDPGSGVASVIGNVLWIILFGWWLALGHLVSGVLLCLTIIGIPLGLANFKIIPITMVPLGVRIVPVRQRLCQCGLNAPVSGELDRFVRTWCHRGTNGPFHLRQGRITVAVTSDWQIPAGCIGCWCKERPQYDERDS